MLDFVGHDSLQAQLRQTLSTGRIAHAQLFTGPAGVGKLRVAHWYAQCILSRNAPEQAFRVEKLEHPDLHFVFPIAPSEKAGKRPTSDQFLGLWRSFVREAPYGDLNDWYARLGLERKQGRIGVDEVRLLTERLVLKSFLSDYKVVILWQVDKLNEQAANKLLKMLEEPPENTVFILIAEQRTALLPTLVSRTQELNFKPLSEAALCEALQAEGVTLREAQRIAHQAGGSYGRALQLRDSGVAGAEFERCFDLWLQAATRAPRQPEALQAFIPLAAELAALSRDRQQAFLQFSLGVFRQALFGKVVLAARSEEERALESPFSALSQLVHSGNIAPIADALNEAADHIGRNVNARILFLDLSIRLTRLLQSL